MDRTGWTSADVALAAARSRNITGCVVRDCPDEQRDGFKIMRYREWFAMDPPRRGRANGVNDRSFCCMTHKASHVRAIAQFRLGVHWLKVEKDRSRGLPRSYRHCDKCGSNEVEDELHLMTCTAYEGMRHRFPMLFDNAAYQSLCDAISEHSTDIDSLFKGYINGQGIDFWHQLGDFLIVSQKFR